jgi:hypothetical protein
MAELKNIALSSSVLRPGGWEGLFGYIEGGSRLPPSRLGRQERHRESVWERLGVPHPARERERRERERERLAERDNVREKKTWPHFINGKKALFVC